MDLTIAAATVLREALATHSALITGDIDGKRRSPWDNHDMNADEGERVSAQLRTEASYWALIKNLEENLTDIADGISR